MSIKRLNGAGLQTPKSIKVWDQTTLQNDYQSIATVIVPSGGQASVSFTNIPQNFTNLKIHAVVRADPIGGSNATTIQLNGNRPAYTHYLYGAGSGTPASGGSTGATAGNVINTPNSANTINVFGVGIIDILNYTSNKNKTIRSIGGYDATNAVGEIAQFSAIVTDTNPVTTITLFPQSTSGSTTYNWVENTQFSLYGIKAAS